MGIGELTLALTLDGKCTDAVELLALLTLSGVCTTLAMHAVRDAVHAGLVTHN